MFPRFAPDPGAETVKLAGIALPLREVPAKQGMGVKLVIE